MRVSRPAAKGELMRRRFSTRMGLTAVALLLGALLAAAPAAAQQTSGDRSYRQVGYFTQWASTAGASSSGTW